ncbi:MAG: hypothetical protein L0099_17335, partial [Acidobacteria bacterium]|nr:hypothetical protein [Acidobacteriota bacterium]
MLQQYPGRPIAVFIVWEPILSSDWTSPGSGVLGRIPDARAAQFWDPEHLVARQLRQALLADPQHPKPQCCETPEQVLWDLVAVYP